MNSDESLLDTIEPKSDQLNADDLVTGPMTVTIRDVARGQTSEQPVQIVLDGHRPYMPCKSMRRVLIAAWGDRGKDWIDKSLTLYCDPTVKFGGVAVGGIRISHLSHLDNDLAIMLTTTRSRRALYKVARLKAAAPTNYPQADFETNVSAWVQAVVNGKITIPALAHKVSSKGFLGTEQIATIENMVTAAQGAILEDAAATHRAAEILDGMVVPDAAPEDAQQAIPEDAQDATPEGAQQAAQGDNGEPAWVTADELADRAQAARSAGELAEVEDLARGLADPAERSVVRAILEQRSKELGL